MIKTDYAFSQTLLLQQTAGTVDLLLRFRADVPQSPRRKLNLSLVIDRSGSMAGTPLQHALRAAEAVVDKLEADDILSLVVYDDKVDTILPPQAVSDKATIKQLIRKVRAGGTTNLSGGWIKGCEHVKAKYDASQINRVLLLTDGYANEGITDHKVLISTAGKKAEEGIVTTTLGFGTSFEEDLLIGMARAASGNFYFIQSLDDAQEVFSIELDSLKSVVAQNLSLTVEPKAGAKIVDVLSLCKVEQKNGQTVLALGNVYEGEDKLLGLSLEYPALTKPTEVLAFSFSADAIKDGVIETVKGISSVTAQVGSAEEVMGAASASDTVMEINRLRIAKVKEQAVELTDEGKHADAEKLLRLQVDDLRKKGLEENFEIAEEIAQLEHYAGRIAKKQLDNNSRKELCDQSFQALNRNRGDLSSRGVAESDEVLSLTVVSEVGSGVELACVREGGKLRIKIISDGYNDLNVQFPRGIRAEGAKYVVESLQLSNDGTFYRASGNITRLSRPGEPDQFVARTQRRSTPKIGKASTAPATPADLETTDAVGDGILVQCVKDGSKLRARVVSDNFDPTWNMRFPRSIREEGMLYVVDEVLTGPDGKSYIACGKVKRFVQAVS